jgi:hypothetical protein
LFASEAGAPMPITRQSLCFYQENTGKSSKNQYATIENINQFELLFEVKYALLQNLATFRFVRSCRFNDDNGDAGFNAFRNEPWFVKTAG